MTDLLEHLRSPAFLPSQEEVRIVCESYKSEDFSYHDGEGRMFNSVTMEDFYALFPEMDAFEILTKEFMTSLGGYIASKIARRNSKEPYIILELGAGSGRLAYFLKQELEERVSGRFRFHATDSGECEMHDLFGMVEPLDYVEALKKYEPNMVLVSWMPLGIDWSKSIRRTPSVEEYILIGEDGGCVGDEWLTWGVSSSLPYGRKRHRAPWVRDCFVQELLREVSNLQINRRSESRGTIVDRIHSRTFSFRRGR